MASTKEIYQSKETKAVKEMLRACIQCGTCTASCPNCEFMDITPRHMWRLLLTDQVDAVFQSKSFAYCSSCYYCTLRCPRGLELTVAMTRLKQTAARLKLKQFRKAALFYQTFLDSVKKHGRVNEMELMTRYFWALKNPVTPIGYASLGIKMMLRGKLKPAISFSRQDKLGAVFNAVAQLE